MESNQQPNTEFKLGPIKATFNEKDTMGYKITVISVMILFTLSFILILKIYVLPFLFFNGGEALISKFGMKITSFIKLIKGIPI